MLHSPVSINSGKIIYIFIGFCILSLQSNFVCCRGMRSHNALYGSATTSRQTTKTMNRKKKIILIAISLALLASATLTAAAIGAAYRTDNSKEKVRWGEWNA